MFIYFLILLPCLYLIIRSAMFLIKSSRILQKGILVEGKVIDLKKKQSMFFKDMGRPVIEFTTANGKTITGEFSELRFIRSFDLNSKVLIVYDPKDPSTFFIDSRYADLISFTILSLAASASLIAIYRLYLLL